MHEPPVAELLPSLYRDVLDAVADLERVGLRAEAGRVRADAIRAYSSSWNQVASRRLRRLRDEARRSAAERRRLRPAQPWDVLRRRTPEGHPA